MSRKNRDKYNRFRSKTIAFRVSEEENKTLETKVALSGLTKQDYLIHCIEQRDYVVDGKNTRVWKAEYSGVAEPCFPLKEPPTIPVKRANLPQMRASNGNVTNHV